MRVIVTGASGNIGTSLLRRLEAEPDVTEVVGVARRHPGDRAPYDRVAWCTADLGTQESVERLCTAMRGGRAVVHCAWRIIGDRDRAEQMRTNRSGTRNVVDAALRAGVDQFVHLSSAAVYTPAPHSVRVDEGWFRRGVGSSAYSRDKVAVEDLLDQAVQEHPELQVTRIRPPTVLQPAAAGEIPRFMLGGLAPVARWTRGTVPVLALPCRAVTQFVSADDVADLAVRAILAGAGGSFNVADEPPLQPAVLARLLGGVHVPVPASALRAALDMTWRVRLQPLHRSWLDLLLGAPLLDTSRARTELGWCPAQDSRTTVRDFRAGVARGAGTASKPLLPLD